MFKKIVICLLLGMIGNLQAIKVTNNTDKTILVWILQDIKSRNVAWHLAAIQAHENDTFDRFPLTTRFKILVKSKERQGGYQKQFIADISNNANELIFSIKPDGTYGLSQKTFGQEHFLEIEGTNLE